MWPLISSTFLRFMAARLLLMADSVLAIAWNKQYSTSLLNKYTDNAYYYLSIVYFYPIVAAWVPVIFS